MVYGQELVDAINNSIENIQRNIDDRMRRINNCEVEDTDCFMSQSYDEREISSSKNKLNIIKKGGCDWFLEYATLDGKLVNARWCNTKYGYSLRAEMPDGSVVWTTANTNKGLAKKGLKKVECYRPAWINNNGHVFPSRVNYATVEDALEAPIKIREIID